MDFLWDNLPAFVVGWKAGALTGVFSTMAAVTPILWVASLFKREEKKKRKIFHLFFPDGESAARWVHNNREHVANGAELVVAAGTRAEANRAVESYSSLSGKPLVETGGEENYVSGRVRAVSVKKLASVADVADAVLFLTGRMSSGDLAHGVAFCNNDEKKVKKA